MSELLEKLSSYNLLNYLIPGTVFIYISEATTKYSFHSDDVFISAFICYFFGMVVSRIGSLTVEPLFKKVKFLRYAKYSDYVYAVKEDSQIETLLETNNTYRTLCALFLCLGLLYGYEWVETAFPHVTEYSGIASIIALFVLFAISYRKQTAYIRARIEAVSSRRKD